MYNSINLFNSKYKYNAIYGIHKLTNYCKFIDIKVINI